MTQLLNAAPLVEAVLARLRTHLFLQVFDGEPQAVLEPDRKAAAYAAVYPGAGMLSAPALSGQTTEMLWDVQVTCAGGDRERCQRAVAWTRSLLVDWKPNVAGMEVNPLTEQPGYQPRVLLDRAFTPPRVYVPLYFQTDVTPNPYQNG